MMQGFGVHTFRLVNDAGEGVFVKFHWKPLLGVHSLLWDECQQIAGKDPDFNRRDLWDAIESSQFPEWELRCSWCRNPTSSNSPSTFLIQRKSFRKNRFRCSRSDAWCWIGTPTTSLPRQNRSHSTRPTWCRESTSPTTRCFSFVTSPTWIHN